MDRERDQAEVAYQSVTAEDFMPVDEDDGHNWPHVDLYADLLPETFPGGPS